uniref:Uncharacterized protein n=1 Tax=Electrophorus electricus TaxID=8005 RepID=A0A4W4HP76_ELEEL
FTNKNLHTCQPFLCTSLLVVILLFLCTMAALAFVMYRYLCHNKGTYRTTGEPAPGLDPDQVYNDTVTQNKKEYFI